MGERRSSLPRLRHHGSAYLYVPLHRLRVPLPTYPPVPQRLEWAEFFANGLPPDALDVGCGEGGFLRRFAAEHPENNILGLEVRKALVEWLAERLRQERRPNAAVLWYSVVNGLPFLAEGSLHSIFYLFPDPWPKKRHHKRRALTPFVVQEFARVLRPDGVLYIATDSPPLDEHHRAVLEASGLFRYEYVREDSEWGLPQTDREQSCRRRGVPYVRMRCYRSGL